MEPISPVPSQAPAANDGLTFTHQGMPYGHLANPDQMSVFTLDKATPTLPYMFIEKDQMLRRLRIRRDYPGVYSTLEDDVELGAAVYKFFYDLWKKTNDPWYANFLYIPVFGRIGYFYYEIVSILERGVQDDPNPQATAAASLKARDYSSEYSWYAGRYLYKQEHYDALQTIKTYIEEFYKSKGLEWHYFIAVNKRDPRVQANLGLLDLTPQNFEIGSASLDRAQEALQHLRTRGTIRVDKHKAPYVGWTPARLIDAIQQSGLAEPDGRILRSKVGVGHTSYAAHWQVHVAGLTPMGPAWLPKLYYETLYRKLFDTLSYLDWQTACALPHISTTYLQQLATEAFGLPTYETNKMDRATACAAMAEAAAARREFSKVLKEHLPFQQQAILLQPGSRWVQGATQQTRAQMGEIQITHPYERMVFVRALCEDPQVTTDVVLAKLGTVGMGDLTDRVDLRGKTKAEVCEFFMERLMTDAERFEFVLVDCRNPAISKRHIINTLTIMGLGGVFKNIDLATATKAEICAIAERYIQVLMEDRALTLAK